MATTVRSYAKINIGLAIGPRRPDAFHDLRTVYQTIGLHDLVRVQVALGSGIELRCGARGVPTDESNTCYRVAERVLRAVGRTAKITIEIEKRLRVQGGLGGASSNAVATLLALERELEQELPVAEKFKIAAAVGSDLPLFLVGGTVWGAGRGEEVCPVPDLPPIACVVATPDCAISTPRAFADWDADAKLTAPGASDRMNLFSSAVFLWLNGFLSRPTGQSLSGVPAAGGGGRAETLLLDLVRTGIANDFERVVFPQNPELSEVKRVLEREGAQYASLSGSGSALYGLFALGDRAEEAARKLQSQGVAAQVTTTVNREEYWDGIFEP